MVLSRCGVGLQMVWGEFGFGLAVVWGVLARLSVSFSDFLPEASLGAGSKHEAPILKLALVLTTLLVKFG